MMGYVRRIGQQGKVVVLDQNMKVRWEVDKVNYPVYACMSRRDRVLVCEQNANRVCEYDSKGTQVWTKTLTTQPVYVQRLSNGGMFIASRNQLLELDRSNREVHTINRPGYDVLAACRHRDGTYTVITTNGQCVKLDKSGTQKSAFAVGNINFGLGLKVHYLPKGGVVVPDYGQGKVREYDANGKLVRDINTGFSFRPTGVAKLHNGNYLVCSRNSTALKEYNKDGKEVATHNVPATGGRWLQFVERK
jgi:hypothetical protein